MFFREIYFKSLNPLRIKEFDHILCMCAPPNRDWGANVKSSSAVCHLSHLLWATVLTTRPVVGWRTVFIDERSQVS